MRNIIRKLAVCFLAWILVCTTVVTGRGMHTAKAAQTFKIHFIDVGCADAALLQYGEGTEAKYALIDTGANQYHNTKDTTIDTTKTPVYEYLNKMGVKHLEFILLTHLIRIILEVWRRFLLIQRSRLIRFMGMI